MGIEFISEEYGLKNNPILICGCHGAGTSYMAKLLRFNGLFIGDDAGTADARKFHESEMFKNINKHIYTKFGKGTSGLVDAFTDRFDNDIKDVSKFNEMAESLIDILKLNFDGYINKNKFITSDNIKWGWKDPRNSVTIPFWKIIFPKIKILVIEKKWSSGKSKSSAGKWFRERSTKTLRAYYMNPPGLDKSKDDYLIVKFEKIVSDINEFNKINEWAGLKVLNQDEYDKLLSSTRFEGVS